MSWNRESHESPAEVVNAAAAEFGLRVTGDAAMDPGSADFAMFSDDGNRAVAEVVRRARVSAAAGEAEDEVVDRVRQGLRLVAASGHEEVWDTMVRETVAYALDAAWYEAYDHDFPYGELG